MIVVLHATCILCRSPHSLKAVKLSCHYCSSVIGLPINLFFKSKDWNFKDIKLNESSAVIPLLTSWKPRKCSLTSSPNACWTTIDNSVKQEMSVDLPTCLEKRTQFFNSLLIFLITSSFIDSINSFWIVLKRPLKTICIRKNFLKYHHNATINVLIQEKFLYSDAAFSSWPRHGTYWCAKYKISSINFLNIFRNWTEL